MSKQKVIITKGDLQGKRAFISGPAYCGGVYLVDQLGERIWNGQFASFDLSWIEII